MGRSTQILDSTQMLKLTLVCSSAIAILGWNSVPMYAQSNPTFPSGDQNGGQDINNLWNNSSGQGTSSLPSLLNRLQLLNGQSAEDFNAGQQEGFNSAVEEFRKKQLEKTQDQSTGSTPPTPGEPGTAPQ